MDGQNRRQQFMRGMRASIPIGMGFLPVAISYAIIARQAGLTTLQIGLMSLTVFAGASQMMAAGMVIQGAGLAAIIVATFLLNLRHVIMSTCVFETMAPSRIAPRLLASYWVTDESFAVFTTGVREEDRTVWFFIGLGLSTYIVWAVGGVLGALLTNFLPDVLSASLGVALYALFIALLMPGLKGNGRLALLALLTAVCNSLLSRVMAASWSLVVSTLLCAFLGVFFVDLGEEAAHE